MKKIKLIPILISVFILICMCNWASAAEDRSPASEYLCEYGIRLYKQGHIDDAIQQLRNALMINPNNSIARNYLNKILSGQEKQPLVQEEKIEYKPPKSKPATPKVNLPAKKNVVSHQKKLEAVKDVPSTKNTEVLKLSQQFKSKEELYKTKLLEKEKEIENLKLAYDDRMKKMDKEIKTKESKLIELKADQESTLEENRKIENMQLMKIEELLKKIKEVLYEIGEPIGNKESLLEENKEGQQLAKIEELMQRIEGVLPRVN